MGGASLFLPEVRAYFEWARVNSGYWHHPLTQGRWEITTTREPATTVSGHPIQQPKYYEGKFEQAVAYGVANEMNGALTPERVPMRVREISFANGTMHNGASFEGLSKELLKYYVHTPELLPKEPASQP